MWTVVFPRPLYERVAALLDGARPLEGGCYLTADRLGGAGAGWGRLLARGIVPQGPGSWNARGVGIIDPSSRYTHAAMAEAGGSGRSLLFVHSHPSGDRPAEFSGADEAANARFFGDMSRALGGRPHASTVRDGSGGMAAAVGHGGRMHGKARIDVVGRVLERHGGGWRGAGGGGAGSVAGGAHARQAAALGPAVHGLVRDLDVCIVGVGGVGSAVAVQLARMGAGRIRLVDHDLVEESNAGRMYGCEPGRVGAPKVEAVADHLRSFSESDIVEVRADVSDALGDAGPVAAADAVVCCTDNLRSRDRLNEAALRWHKPLIDSGCSVAAAGGGPGRAAPESTAYAQLVTPETACLWCTGQIDGRRLGYEFLSDAQRRAKRDAGYYEPDQPSLVTYTTWAACLAADKLLGFLGLYGRRSDASYVGIAGEFCRHRSPVIKAGCVCERLRPGGPERRQGGATGSGRP